MAKDQINTPKAVTSAAELGEKIRDFRNARALTLETVSGLSNLSVRFLSELERGKETAELGKALEIINKLGLEVIIAPRGFNDQVQKLLEQDHD